MVLYRFSGDLVHALNVSLGQARYQASNIPATEKKTNSGDFQTTLSEACLALNAKYQANISKDDRGRCSKFPSNCKH